MEAHAGKFRPLLLDSVPSLDDSSVKSSSQKALHRLSDISKAVSEHTVLIGVGPATGLCSRCLRCCNGAVYVQRGITFKRLQGDCIMPSEKQQKKEKTLI